MASGTERHSSNVLEKFNITIKDNEGVLHPHEVSGYKLNIPGCPEAKLFVHESIDPQKECWCVTEETSGFKLCTGASKPAAVGRARRMITEKYETFMLAVKNAQAVRASGKAPVETVASPVQPVEDAQVKTIKVAAKPEKS